MPIGDKYVHICVVIVVEESGAPTHLEVGWLPETNQFSDIFESIISSVTIESATLTGEIRDPSIKITVVVEIPEVYAHARLSNTFRITDADVDTDFDKRASPTVLIQVIRSGVVCDKEIDVTVQIVVCGANP